jgi:diguanylate cyclase (GGDEF)-like protein
MGLSAGKKVAPFEQRLQHRLQAVLEAMPVAVSWASLQTQQIEFVNREFTGMFGYVLGDHATVSEWIETTYINPMHAQRAGDMWYKHFQNITSETVQIPQVEVDVRCKDGSVKSTLLGGVILPDVGWALATFVDITELKESEAQLTRLALEDPLTSLPNRRAFTEAMKNSLARAGRSNSSVALLLVDLDGFKPLNDTLGHDRGDVILQTMARRLLETTRAGDLACRIGGDEFAVIVDGIADVRVAEEVADRIIKAMQQPFTLDGESISMGASVGISIHPLDSATDTELFKTADLALYRAKNSGRGRWSR